MFTACSWYLDSSGAAPCSAQSRMFPKTAAVFRGHKLALLQQKEQQLFCESRKLWQLTPPCRWCSLQLFDCPGNSSGLSVVEQAACRLCKLQQHIQYSQSSSLTCPTGIRHPLKHSTSCRQNKRNGGKGPYVKICLINVQNCLKKHNTSLSHLSFLYNENFFRFV